jgi:alanyl-tRNA synthetase
VRTERINKKLRVHFVCGANALKYFQSVHNVVTTVARQLDTSPENVPGAVEKLSEAMRAAQKELQELHELKLSVEAKQLAARAESMEGVKLIVASFRNRSAQELRALAMQLQNEPGIVALLATYDGAKISGVVACAPDTRVSANDLMREWLKEFTGRGGGDARVAQGGGAASEEQFAACLANVRNYVRALQKL